MADRVGRCCSNSAIHRADRPEADRPDADRPDADRPGADRPEVTLADPWCAN